MKPKIGSLILFILLTTQLNATELVGDISMVSDYRLRGISQTAGSEALQGSIESHFHNGVFVGALGSNVDFGNNTNLELDYYLGYADAFSSGIGYALTFSYFTFQGHESENMDFSEGSVSLYYHALTFNYTRSEDTVNTATRSEHLALGYRYQIMASLQLNLHAEHNFGEFYGSYDINDYQNYEFGLIGKLSEFEISGKYIWVKTDRQDKVNAGLFRNDDSFTISARKEF